MLIKGLIDMGAKLYFISNSIVERLKLKRYTLSIPIRISSIGTNIIIEEVRRVLIKLGVAKGKINLLIYDI